MERCDTTRFVEGTFASAYHYQIKPAGMGHPIPQHKNAQVKKILEANDGSADVQAVKLLGCRNVFLGFPGTPTGMIPEVSRWFAHARTNNLDWFEYPQNYNQIPKVGS